MSFKPFLIAPFATGLDTDIEPWLLPQDAFTSIVNGHIHHGVIEKRQGYTRLGDIVHNNGADWDISDITAANPPVVTVTSTTGLSDGDVIEVRNVAGMTEVNGQRYVVANSTPTTLELSGVIGATFTAYTGSGEVYLIPQDEVMGLERYIDSTNVKEVLAFDTRRVSAYDPSNKHFVAVDTSDVFSGDEEDYFWTANWASTASTTASTLHRIYMTNGVATGGTTDGIRYYNRPSPRATTLFRPQINSLTFINGCRLIFAIQERLLLLHTVEGGNTYPQRARWCQAQNPDAAGAWDDNVAGKGGFVDAPTGDHIVSARQLRDYIIVFCTNSIWALQPTPDPSLPFAWKKINDFRACDAKMSSIEYDKYVIAAGVRGITGTDGVQSQRIDTRIQDFVQQSVNITKFLKTFGRRSYGSQRAWMLYPKSSPESEVANAALIYDDESQAFSTYDIAMNVLGYGGAAEDAACDDFGDKTCDEFDDETCQDFFQDEAAEIFLGGDRAGGVWIMEHGGDDAEVLFEAAIIGITQADPAVVTMVGDQGIADGDVISLSDIVGMTELNDRSFTVGNKSGNTFELLDEDSSGHTAYTSGGTVRSVMASQYEVLMDSAAWNPWASEGRQAQFGYLDIYVDTHPSTQVTVEFFKNSEGNPYKTSVSDLLGDQGQICEIVGATQTNPVSVSAPQHGLATGETCYIYGVRGMSAINGQAFIVTAVGEDGLQLGVDGTGYDEYAGGGVITRRPYKQDTVWKRFYSGATGFQHKVRISSTGNNTTLRIHALKPWFKPVGSRLL